MSTFALDLDQLSALDTLRPKLPGAWRPANKAVPREQFIREREFDRSLKSGRGFKAALETAQRMKRHAGHALHDDRPPVPFNQIHEPFVRHCRYAKAP